MTEEKRRFSRVVYQVESELTVKGEVYTFDKLVDLSVGGCQLGLQEQIEPGTECTLLMKLNPADRRMNIEVAGQIVRCDDKCIGVKFTTIDPEGLIHLQNIIRYNSDDPDIIEEEITKRPGLV